MKLLLAVLVTTTVVVSDTLAASLHYLQDTSGVYSDYSRRYRYFQETDSITGSKEQVNSWRGTRSYVNEPTTSQRTEPERIKVPLEIAEKLKIDINKSDTNSKSINVNHPNKTINSSQNIKVSKQTHAQSISNNTIDNGAVKIINEDNNINKTIERIFADNEQDDDEHWIWLDGEETTIPPITIIDLNDRAAFTGNQCPTGKVKIVDKCVEPD